MWSLLPYLNLYPYATSEAATARPASPRKRGIRPTTVAVVPVRFALSITVLVTGIAAATSKMTAKITFMIGLLAPFFVENIFLLNTLHYLFYISFVINIILLEVFIIAKFTK